MTCISDHDPDPRGDSGYMAAYSAAWAEASAGNVDASLAIDLRDRASMTLDRMLTEYGDSELLKHALMLALGDQDRTLMAGVVFRQWVESACAGYARDNEGVFQ